MSIGNSALGELQVDRLLVISADGHAGPTAEIYREYLDPSFRGRFDEHQRTLAATVGQLTSQDFVKQWEEETGGDGGLSAGYDGDARNAILDEEGVAAEVLFPDADVLGTGRLSASPFGSGLAAGSQSDPADAVAGARAHNRWLADFVDGDPHRRIGVAVIPAIIPDMGTVLAMTREAADLGHRGVLIPTRWFDQPAYHDPAYDTFFALVEELGLVLHTHSGAGPADFGLGRSMLPIYASESGWWAARPLHVLIWAGVFERCPTLRYSMAENGCWWVPDVIRKMDEKWIGGHNTRKFGDAFREVLTMKPSEYLDRNCYFGVSTPGRDDIERRELVGVGNIMWGNDLPHPEGTFPYTRFWVRERFRGVDRSDAERMLGRTAAEVYGVDVDALQPVVDKVGITDDEIWGDVLPARQPTL